MSSQIIFILLAGALGGALRGVLGIAKEMVAKKDAQVNWPWFWVSILIAGILGIITATFFMDDLRIALIGGYAGSDFLEGLMKIVLKNRFTRQNLKDLDGQAPKKEGQKKSQFGELMRKGI